MATIRVLDVRSRISGRIGMKYFLKGLLVGLFLATGSASWAQSLQTKAIVGGHLVDLERGK